MQHSDGERGAGVQDRNIVAGGFWRAASMGLAAHAGSHGRR